MANCTQYLGFPITNTGQRQKLVALGKALFWDMRVGSDGVTACASCHFHAGADSRAVNQFSPGLNRMRAPLAANQQAQLAAALNPNQLTGAEDLALTGATGATALVAASATQPAVPAQTSRPAATVNGKLTSANFPLIGNPRDTAAPNFGNNDVISSQGVHSGTFTAVNGTRSDTGTYHSTDAKGFNLSDGPTARRVEPRNTPTTIMSGFNLRNFWDGRANMFFNGVNPFGMLDPAARIMVNVAGTNTPTQVMLPFSSLASQAVGPPGNPIEMSLDGRNLRHIGNKLLTLNADVPLDGQHVDANDSSLRIYANGGTGLNKSYKLFIQEVFRPKFWSGPNVGALTLMEHNFGFFFGVAVQAYEATLVPDQTPLDPILAFMTPLIQAGVLPDAALTSARNAPACTASNTPAGCINSSLPLTGTFGRQALVDALRVFLTPQSNCFVCHVGAEFAGGTVSALTGFGRPVAAPPAPGAAPAAIIERMFMGDGTQAVYDSGFYNIGVRPTFSDLSIFNRTPGNVPFSIGMLSKEILRGNTSTAATAALLASGNLRQPTAAVGFPNFTVNLNPSPVTGFIVGCAPPSPNATANGVVDGQGCNPLDVDEQLGIRGAFKTSTLRNIKFTGPLFHNGGRSTVTDVMAGHYNVGAIFNLAFNPDNCALTKDGTSATKGCLKGQVDFGPGISPMGLTAAQITGIANLIEFGLTDNRVAKESGPFDHPQLCVPVGHVGPAGNSSMAEVPAVGSATADVAARADLQTFTEAMAHDTSKAHNLVAGSCTMAGLSVSPHPK